MAPGIGAFVASCQVRPPSRDRAKLFTTPMFGVRSPPARMPCRASRKAMLNPPPAENGVVFTPVIGAVVAPQVCPRSVLKKTRVVHRPSGTKGVGGTPVVIHARRCPWVAMHVPPEAKPDSPGSGVGRLSP